MCVCSLQRVCCVYLNSHVLINIHSHFMHVQVVYKLTDFGYAKSYDQSSVCTSLVGTMQYVVSYCTCGNLTLCVPTTHVCV